MTDKFLVGGFVKVLITGVADDVKVGDILPITLDDPTSMTYKYDLNGVELDYVKSYPEEFESFELPGSFECVDQTGLRFTGKYIAPSLPVTLSWSRKDGHNESGSKEHDLKPFLNLLSCGSLSGFKPLQVFGKISSQGDSQEPEPLGAYRPNLEDRKVGKVSIELVDTGFPNALWELAKVMTWAAEVKGYKPNDWKNLPNAKTALQSAASRHRMKPLLGEDFDVESGFHHKAHEAFNVLAELELLVSGKLNEGIRSPA